MEPARHDPVSGWDYDVVIVGAGLSGITAAYYLKHKTNKSFIVVDRHPTFGGTWELFKYPGIRSDSDMYSFSFSFHPWQKEMWFGSAGEIINYLGEVMDKYKLHDGYYDHEEGYTPDFEGFKDFKGDIIHPQFWPKNFHCDGKKIVVIGSGATAITLVPELSKLNAAKVTMLQRSPTFIGPVADHEQMGLVSRSIYGVIGQPFKNALFRYRRFNAIFWNYFFFYVCKTYPNLVKRFWFARLKNLLGEEKFKRHFKPSYNPWDQRVCAAPNGDFYKQYVSKKFNIVTEHIKRFTGNGIDLKNGEHIDCDTIITATGLKLLPLGGIHVTVDNVEVDIGKQFTYKGFMLTNLPNLFWVTGYTNASWTLKAELSCSYIARLISFMGEKKYGHVVPVMDEKTRAEGHTEGFDLESGYVLRYKDLIPKQGVRYPWKVYQNYFIDMYSFSGNNFQDGVANFSKL